MQQIHISVYSFHFSFCYVLTTIKWAIFCTIFSHVFDSNQADIESFSALLATLTTRQVRWVANLPWIKWVIVKGFTLVRENIDCFRKFIEEFCLFFESKWSPSHSTYTLFSPPLLLLKPSSPPRSAVWFQKYLTPWTSQSTVWTAIISRPLEVRQGVMKRLVNYIFNVLLFHFVFWVLSQELFKWVTEQNKDGLCRHEKCWTITVFDYEIYQLNCRLFSHFRLLFSRCWNPLHQQRPH